MLRVHDTTQRIASEQHRPIGSNFPCKGYHDDRPLEPVVTYRAGETANLTLVGSATHNGGSCQISLSYDRGKTFKVIQSMIGGCPLKSEYDFPIPVSAPNGPAILAWSWYNLIGNREMYMNCAPVAIEGGRNRSAEFNNLPDLFVANVGNGCKTVENKHTVFPNPGDNVIWDGVPPDAEPFPVC
ncbi:hypothetical protein VTO42DRAFT_7100 [Malbranchea cinnamomea]